MVVGRLATQRSDQRLSGQPWTASWVVQWLVAPLSLQAGRRVGGRPATMAVAHLCSGRWPGGRPLCHLCGMLRRYVGIDPEWGVGIIPPQAKTCNAALAQAQLPSHEGFTVVSPAECSWGCPRTILWPFLRPLEGPSTVKLGMQGHLGLGQGSYR